MPIWANIRASVLPAYSTLSMHCKHYLKVMEVLLICVKITQSSLRWRTRNLRNRAMTIPPNPLTWTRGMFRQLCLDKILHKKHVAVRPFWSIPFHQELTLEAGKGWKIEKRSGSKQSCTVQTEYKGFSAWRNLIPIIWPLSILEYALSSVKHCFLMLFLKNSSPPPFFFSPVYISKHIWS